MKKAGVFYITQFLLPIIFVCAGETRLEFGKDDGFRGMALLQGLDTVRGADGTSDLVLRDRQETGAAGPDIYLGFDEEPIRDTSLSASVRNENNAVIISRSHKMRGKGAAAFQYGARLLLEPAGKTPFPRSMVDGDFVIGFWMYPVTLGEGEIIFRWENTSTNLSGKGPPVYQELSCLISGRVLLWTFTNFFQAPGVREKTLSVQGSVPLVPRSWHHHALYFDASTGMIEYRVDGEPEAILYATGSGGEDGGVFYPYAGEQNKSPLVIGEGFTGFLDEFYVSRSPLPDTDLSAFSAEGGMAETPVIDLGYGGSSLLRIEAVYRAESSSAVFFYYKLEETTGELQTADWTPFTPGESPPRRTEGRYLLVRAELFPDGKREISPRLMDFTIVYEKNSAPPPPSFVAAVPGDGKVDLRWSAVAHPGVEGYFVYYGSRPGVYDGKESNLGPSPIRAGEQTRLTLDGLVNGKLYYFAITTYDKHSGLSGQFSNEVSSRPSRLYHREE